MAKKILLTGGAGFVGRHLAKRLLEAGHEVHCVDPIAPLTGGLAPEDWPLFDPREFKNFKFYREDCRAWFKRVNDTDFEYAYHLAAVVGGRAMIESQPLAVADDLSIDSEYWQWALRAKPKKTVCFSSSAAYPVRYQERAGYRLLSEDLIDFSKDLGVPDYSYGWAKLTNEYLAKLAYEKHGLRSVTYRPFSGYGEDQDEHYPFPSICKRVLERAGQSRITVWGTGDQMRDFIHIEDCVDGILKTVDQIDDGSALNLSTGILTSFRDFARMAAQQVGYTPEVVGQTDQPAGVFARGGCTKKQEAHGFRAAVPFAEGVRRALEYFAKLPKD